MQKVKVTKRQRKALGRNAMVHQCKMNGKRQEVGGTSYIGEMSYRPGTPRVPFVRA